MRYRRRSVSVVVGLGAILAAFGFGYLIAANDVTRWGIAILATAAVVTTTARRRQVEAISQDLVGLAIDPPRRRRIGQT